MTGCHQRQIQHAPIYPHSKQDMTTMISHSQLNAKQQLWTLELKPSRIHNIQDINVAAQDNFLIVPLLLAAHLHIPTLKYGTGSCVSPTLHDKNPLYHLRMYKYPKFPPEDDEFEDNLSLAQTQY